MLRISSAVGSTQLGTGVNIWKMAKTLECNWEADTNLCSILIYRHYVDLQMHLQIRMKVMFEPTYIHTFTILFDFVIKPQIGKHSVVIS